MTEEKKSEKKTEVKKSTLSVKQTLDHVAARLTTLKENMEAKIAAIDEAVKKEREAETKKSKDALDEVRKMISEKAKADKKIARDAYKNVNQKWEGMLKERQEKIEAAKALLESEGVS